LGILESITFAGSFNDLTAMRKPIQGCSGETFAAEYLGPLETAAENLSRVRDIDEQFGGSHTRPSRMAIQAEQHEKGVAYLLGVLSVAVTSDNLSAYNCRLVERDVQEVHSIAGHLRDKEQKQELKAAA